MKRFIYKIVLFIIPVLLLPVLILPIDSYILNDNILQSNKDVIIVGDSHTQTGINDNFDNRLYNISQSSETYFFTYYKLRKLISVKKPSAIILGFSPHNLSFFQDEKTFALNNEERFKELYPRYLLSMDWHGIQQLYKNSNGKLKSVFHSFLKENIEVLFSKKNAYIGEYRESLKSNLDSVLIEKKIKIHYYNAEENVYEISKLQIEYLNKINDLCKENNISFYILDLPIYIDYQKKIPKEFLHKYNEVLSNLIKNGIQFIDYSKIDLPDDNFGDGDHVNALGAEIITKKLILDLNL